MKTIICFDIGGTKISQAVLKLNLSKFSFLEKKEITNPKKKRLIEKIFLNFTEISRRKYTTDLVAVSSAKLISPLKERVSQAEMIYGVREFDFKFLSSRGFKIRLENDGRCFARGEYFFGLGRKVKSLLTITFGTGLGGGLLIEGENYQGKHFSSLEISHMRFFCQKNKKLVCWENLTGGKAIKENYWKKSKQLKSAKEIFLLAKKGDKKAQLVIQEAEFWAGVGIANLLTIFDPELVIVGGGISNQENFIKKIFKIANKYVFNQKVNYSWKISLLKEKANLLGAASLFFKKEKEEKFKKEIK